MAAEVYAIERGRLASTLRVVREVIRSLGQTPGRKSLVLVTTGFPVDPSVTGFREVRDQAARANVAVSFLDPRGLPLGPPAFSASGKGIPAADISLTNVLWQLNEAGPKVLAEESGGLVLQTNDLVAGLTQVADESRVTYLLGYEPTNGKRDGRYRKLGVEVRRPGLQVRARTGYFAPKGNVKPAPAPAPDPVERALRDLFDADGIPLRLAAYVMGEAPVQSPLAETGFEVLIAGELRLDALRSEVKDGRRVAEPRLKLLTSSRAGESHESEWSLQVTLGPSLPESGDALWHPFVTRIAMSPGDHRARLVVRAGIASAR